MIVVDSDILVDVIRQHPPAVVWFASLKKEPVAVPGYVAMELIQGCTSKVQQRRVELFVNTFEIYWPEAASCDQALETYGRYHLSHSLGLLDSLIAFTAIELGEPLHTFNQKHYAVIRDLKTVQPYAH